MLHFGDTKHFASKLIPLPLYTIGKDLTFLCLFECFRNQNRMASHSGGKWNIKEIGK